MVDDANELRTKAGINNARRRIKMKRCLGTPSEKNIRFFNHC